MFGHVVGVGAGKLRGFARRSTTLLSMKLLAVTHIIAQLTKLHNLQPCYFFNVLLSVNEWFQKINHLFDEQSPLAPKFLVIG